MLVLRSPSLRERLARRLSSTGLKIFTPQVGLATAEKSVLVAIENQLHAKPVPFHVQAAYLLCLPSGKSETKEPPSTPRGLDHFKCYTPTPSSTHLNIPVHLKDQFIEKDFTVIALSLLCNPVEKKVVPPPHKPSPDPTVRSDTIDDKKKGRNVLHPEAHLACYLLDPLVDFPKPKPVTIANQFEPGERVEVRGTELLCVPSIKRD